MASLPASRRSFLTLSGLAPMGLFAASNAPSVAPSPQTADTIVTLEGARLTVRSRMIAKPCRLTVIGDAHYATDDARGEPFRKYSKRMSGGPQKMGPLRQKMQAAKAAGCDAALLLGDILNFPSEAGAEELAAVIREAPLPCLYTAGNHDWHYEGLPGPEVSLRKEWIDKRLRPLYGGRDPMAYAERFGDLKVLMVDDSTYSILPEQLDFIRRELAEGLPTILGVHIPLYVPWRRDDIFFGVGHPDWNAAHDPYHQIERRERWPEAGHTEVTFAFRRELLACPHLLGVVAGHIHTQSLDLFDGKFQFVLPKATPCELLFLPR